MQTQPRNEPDSVDIEALQRRCAAESERFFRRLDFDPQFCFELIRQAIVGRNQQAWHGFYLQYRPLVLGWITRHAAFAAQGEEAEFFINRAYERFWSAISPDRFGEFADLGALLRYLQLCVHSVIVDESRRTQHRSGLPLLDEVLGERAIDEARPSLRAEAEAFWELLADRLNDERERRVIYCSFFLDLRPREIYAESGTMFASVAEVYRIKENVVARLRRDPNLRELFEQAA